MNVVDKREMFCPNSWGAVYGNEKVIKFLIKYMKHVYYYIHWDDDISVDKHK